MASTAYHLQSTMHAKSWDTRIESTDRLDPWRNYILWYRHCWEYKIDLHEQKMAVTIGPCIEKNRHWGGRYDTIRYIDMETTHRYFRNIEASPLLPAKTEHRPVRGTLVRVFQWATSQADHIASASAVGCTDIPTLPAPARWLLLMASLVVRCIALLTATHISHSLLKHDVPGKTIL